MSIISNLKNSGALVLYHDYRNGTAYDLSGNSNHGTLTDTAWTNTGISFPASTSVITVADSAELQLTEFAIIVGSENNDHNSAARIVSKRDAGGRNYELTIASSSSLFMRCVEDRFITSSIIGTKQIAVQAASGETPTAWYDGASEGNLNGTVTITTNDAPLLIGHLYTGSQNYYNTTQYVLIINRRLTSAEHSALYTELQAQRWPTKTQHRLTVASTDTWFSGFGVYESDSNTTGGYLENSPFQVQSGSFKVVTDTIGGALIKSIECVTNGTLLFPSEIDGLDAGWTGWENTGAGYSSGTLSLSSLVYTMTAGDKLALSDLNGLYNIKKV
jgi:hypothetical protein